MLQLILHLFGDYISQSNWMAVNKSKRTWPCLCHCFLYTLPFLMLSSSYTALGIIFGSHFLIDRFRLARYVVWLKNWMAPDGYPRWKWCSMTGYFDPEKAVLPPVNENDPSTPDHEKWVRVMGDADLVTPIWLRVWLLIVADNTLHLTCNALALFYYQP